MRVLIFGDSITQGFWDTEGGWVTRLRKHYDEMQAKTGKFYTKPEVFNLGISGDITKDVLNRLDVETKARKWPGEKLSFIFSMGANDTVYRGEEFESTPKKYRQELEQICRIASQYSDWILFLGLTPVVDERVQPMKWSSTGKCYSNDRIWEFEKELRDFCAENHVAHLPLFEILKEKQATTELMPDGAHPNNEGHELIFKLVQPALDELLNT
ncbi:MAG: GDSL-type esterase/lipase family protein [bacterium]|nr:GDSL-type esterase/lipase family protein [bacterium]